MAYKARTKSNELIILEVLYNRMNLSGKDKQHYFNLKKGYEGEIQFDKLASKFQCDCFILNDLLLETNHTTFQIDSLIITAEKIYFFEVKNYEGDYFYHSDKLYKKPETEILNPLNQLSRSESLLRQILLNLGYKLPIEASVVFINPQFMLYQAPLNIPFIFPTQINRYMAKLNTTSSKMTKNNQHLADKLVSLHITDSPYS
ncbi:Nuclease-related domain-containing protein [Oceanobacillus limi]|uniref:Nuclease-related domain-containing protein n=1 Tax=Oceanobacillus limi TaxID=930131 RepID=A0A1I0C7X1_9BACI|nr:nuclease-related domain-containing protein [Oceanobacillus limi]SET15452.1 Nuclease-related domain-containing protein [Oceanobacillus limi]